MSQLQHGEGASTPQDNSDSAWRVVRDAVKGLQFGTVTVIVQDGVVVQVERTERRRLRPARR